MKILIVSDYFYPDIIGGAEKMALLMTESYIERGFDVEILTTNKTESKEYFYKGARVISLKSSYSEKFRSYVSIINLFVIMNAYLKLKNKRYDKIFVHNIHFRLSYGILFLLRQLSDNICLTLHDAMPLVFGKANFDLSRQKSWFELLNKHGIKFNPFYQFFAKKILSKIKLISVSSRLRELYYFYGYSDISIVNNSIPCVKQDEKYNEFSNDSVITFFLPGRITASKGYDIVVKAFTQLKEEFSNVRLIITSDSSDSLDGVEFTGWVSQSKIKEYYTLSDVILCPSLHLDPFPTVVLEAAAYSKNVIISNSVGSVDFVKDNYNGLIFESGDSNHLFEKMKQCVINSSINNEFGINNKKELKLNSFESFVNKYLEINSDIN